MKLSISKLLLFVIISATVTFAQYTIKGKVTDAMTGDELIGANVIVIGTSLGSTTDIYGDYKIQNISKKEINLKISYIGYKQKKETLTLTEGVTEHNILLSPDIVEGAEVVVTGQALGQAAAINQQVNANTIMNVISEEKIQELPDVNAAEAIGRLPGVSISRNGGEASKAKIRGMADKFSYVTVDAVRVPSTDVDSRGLDLSTVSQGSLAGIELYKALTSDKDADAIAGSINLVTKKAPEKRLLRFDARNIYNRLEKSLEQYDFSVKYGERFFNNLIGLQLMGNIEKRVRSAERYNLSYGQKFMDEKYTDFAMNNFRLEYTDELRDRAGFSILADINTPDSGNIRINNVYNSTKRDYISYSRNYPNVSNASTTGMVTYSARDIENEVKTFTSSLRGENNLFEIDLVWGLSFSQSTNEDLYDYAMYLNENTDQAEQTGMKDVADEFLKGPPESFIQYAWNNFDKSQLDSATFRSQDNLDKEKSMYFDFKKQFVLSELVGELKGGVKYRYKNRSKSTSEFGANNYLGGFRKYTKLADGSIVLKDFKGTRFENLLLSNNITILARNFVGYSPSERNLYDKYRLYPMINRESMREWYELNKNGYQDPLGSSPEYLRNDETELNYYNITERISAAYLMNTFNYDQVLTVITGLRVETEDNTYHSKYNPAKLNGAPIPVAGVPNKDTISTYKETIWLPNLQVVFRPTEYLSIRGAAYKALARPDYNYRLANFIAKDGGSATTMYIGNGQLKAAQAWNFELNTSIFGNSVGLISVSAFYKEISSMFHIINGIRVDRSSILDSLGITWKSPFGTEQRFDLTYPYNTKKPTKVWGFEIEHQANLLFLPGLWKNFVVSYNLSIARSETYVASSTKKVWMDSVEIFPGYKIPRENSEIQLIEVKQKLEGQPEMFGNFSLGYDIFNISARVSMFYQGEYNTTFSGDGRSDRKINSYIRWDLALKYKFNENISFMLNVNNFTDTKETESRIDRTTGWENLTRSERYGPTVDFGLRLDI